MCRGVTHADRDPVDIRVRTMQLDRPLTAIGDDGLTLGEVGNRLAPCGISPVKRHAAVQRIILRGKQGAETFAIPVLTQWLFQKLIHQCFRISV